MFNHTKTAPKMEYFKKFTLMKDQPTIATDKTVIICPGCECEVRYCGCPVDDDEDYIEEANELCPSCGKGVVRFFCLDEDDKGRCLTQCAYCERI